MSNEPKVPRRAERKNLKIVCVNSFFHIIQRQSESFVNCPSSETPNAEMKGGLGRSRRAEGQRGDKIQFIPFLHFLLQKSSDPLLRFAPRGVGSRMSRMQGRSAPRESRHRSRA